MRVCILGSGGMLGHMLVRVLSETHEVYGTSKQEWSATSGLAKFLGKEKWISGVDAKKITTFSDLFRERQFDVVINCIGVVKQRGHRTSEEEMIEVNAHFPHKLSSICDASGARLIHISTDCVFSGSKGNYAVTDSPDPIDIYGSSKLAGEIIDDRNLTIRTSHVGRELTNFTSLFEWILRNRGKKVVGYSKAIYSGLTTFSLSVVIDSLLTTGSSINGLVHVSSSPINKFQLVTELNNRLGLDINIEIDESVVLNRSLLSSDEITQLGIEIPSWDQMLDNFCEDQATYDFVSH
jgi:dTDP-4-dehydrorhamnose reductase